MNRTSPIGKESRPISDRVAYALATGLGAGFSPVAPGTVGSLEGVAIYVGIRALNLGESISLVVVVILDVVLFGVGVWASSRSCEITGAEDPGSIVIDEVSGQLIALTPLLLLPSISTVGLVLGFLLFRLFDIFKPYPIRKLERLHGGLGVMADDALAGVYAAGVLWLSAWVWLT